MAPFAFAHDGPEHRMVGVPAAIVAHSNPRRFWDLFQVGNQRFNRLVSQIGAFERFVQIRDIRLMMLIVMDFHRFSIDVGLQRVERIRQFR